MLGGEPEVSAEAQPLTLGTAVALRGRFGHRVPDPAVQIGDQFVEDLLLALEVNVEGAL